MRGWCATPMSACSGKAPATSTRSTSSPAPSARAARTGTLAAALAKLLDEATQCRRLSATACGTLDRALAFAERVAAEPALEARTAGRERALSRHQRHPDDLGSRPRPARTRAARSMRGSCSNIASSAQDPLAVDAGDDDAIELLLSERNVALGDVVGLLT